jgi:predicted MFS family arabinose efflux permease
MPVATLALMAASVFAAITTEMLPVGLLPLISHDLHTSESSIGLLVSAYAVVVAVGSVPMAALIERWPRGATLCGLLTTYAVSNAIMATTSSYPVALVARLLGGVAHAGFFAAVFGAAVSIAPVARSGRAIAFVGAGNSLALTFGVPLGTALGDAVGWRWAFAACGVVTLGLGIAMAVVVHSQPEPANVRVLRAVRGRAMLVVALIVVLVTLGHFTAYTYVSVLLLHVGVHARLLSVVLFGYGAAGIAGLVAAGAIADRRPRAGLVVATVVIIGCLLVIGLAPGAASTVASVVVWGVAFGALPTLVQTLALRAAPNAPDAAPAVVNATFNVGISGGALIGSRELLVVAPGMLALTGAALACAALLVQVPRRLFG